MNAISQFVISVFELAEAEGRDLRKVVRAQARDVHEAVATFAMGMAVLLVSVPLLVAGVWLMAAGLMWWLETQVARPIAAGVTGLIIIAIGVVCLLLFRSITRRRSE